MVLSMACLWRQCPNQLNDGRTESHENNGWQNKEHEWHNHFDGSLCGLFFGALPALGAQRIRWTRNLRDTCSEAIGLYQGGNQGADIVHSRARVKVTQSFGAGFASAHPRLTMWNSSLSSGWAWRRSSPTRIRAWSSANPASTQITVRSRASGNPRVIWFWRFLINRFNANRGRKNPKAATLIKSGRDLRR